MALNTTDVFKRCVPAIGTNISECGTITLCSAIKPATLDEIETLYKDPNGKLRIAEALFMTQLEGRACGVKQHTFRDFILANVRDIRKNIQLDEQTRTLVRIRPFVLLRRKAIINNNHWKATNGVDAGSGRWSVRVSSTTGIPASTRSFPVGMRVYIESPTTGGSKQFWQGVVYDYGTPGSDYITLILTPQNAGSYFGSVSNPTSGLLRRGTVNVAKSESFCDDEPAYLNKNFIPYWLEHTRYTLCTSDEYQQFRRLILENNPYFAEFVDLPEVEENRQRTEAFWNNWFNNLLFSRPISANQTLTGYTQLPEIQNFASPSNLGFGAGRCAGYKANNVGWLEQLKACGRVVDLQGADLNLWKLTNTLYKILRVRASVGSAASTSFDVFTDAVTAELIDRAFMVLYKEVTSDMLRMNLDVKQGKNASFGFNYTSYTLRGRCSGATLNVIHDYAFDDLLGEWNTLGAANQGRWLWVPDLTDMYAGIVETNRITTTSGKLQDLAKIDPAFQCVEETVTRTVTLNGVTYTSIIECPESHLLLYNFSGNIPTTTYDDSDYTPTTPNV
jgi:hypothetical protein